MTKSELRKELESGKCLADIFNFIWGQDCLICKADEFEVSDNIIYIPDIFLNEIDIEHTLDEDDIKNVLHHCCTGKDFLDECNGHENLARNLFNYVDWQHPDIHDFLEGYDDEEQFLEEYGFPMNEVV